MNNPKLNPVGSFLSRASVLLVLICMMLFTTTHLSAQNSGDLDPATLQIFADKMNDESIALRTEMNDPGNNPENHLAIFNYYIAVRDYYLTNPVELTQAFEAQIWEFKIHDISPNLFNALLEESSPSNSGIETFTANIPVSDAVVELKIKPQFQLLINQLVIESNRVEGLDALFSFIRSHK